MADITNTDKIAVADAARLIGRSHRSVMRWYNWYENYPVPEGVYLPPRHRINRSPTFYIYKSEFGKLKEFAENIKKGGKWYGVMADYNAVFQWKSNVSEKALSNRGLTKLDVRRSKVK